MEPYLDNAGKVKSKHSTKSSARAGFSTSNSIWNDLEFKPGLRGHRTAIMHVCYIRPIFDIGSEISKKQQLCVGLYLDLLRDMSCYFYTIKKENLLTEE